VLRLQSGFLTRHGASQLGWTRFGALFLAEIALGFNVACTRITPKSRQMLSSLTLLPTNIHVSSRASILSQLAQITSSRP
jgi:hypothetical protein